MSPSAKGSHQVSESPFQLPRINITPAQPVAESYSVGSKELAAADSDTDIVSPFKPDMTPQDPNKRNKLIRRLVGGAVVVALGIGGAVIAVEAGASGNDNHPAKNPNNSGEATTLSETDTLQALINKRPEAGTDAYIKQFTDIYTPYVEGQPDEQVVTEFEQNYIKLVKLQYSDVANMSFDDQTKWAIENGTKSREDTVKGIVEQLNLSYYDVGMRTALYGPDANTSEFANTTLPRIQSYIKQAVIDSMLRKEAPDETTYHLINANIIKGKSDATNIYAKPVGYTTSGGGTAENPNESADIHLKVSQRSATQTNWYLVNNSSDTNG